MEQLPTFGLADIPEDWEIRLRSDFVEELDKINRPWKYTPGMKRHDAVLWRSSTVRRRTLDKMSPEEIQQYKEHLSFFNRMWVFKKKHGKKTAKFGSYIMKSQIRTLREGITIEDSELEKAIIGFRPGIANRDKSIDVPRLPITANIWWAWLMGYYFSTGAIWFRDATRRDRMKRDSCVVRLRAPEPVIPLIERALMEVGVKPVISKQKQDKESKAVKLRALRTRRMRSFRLGWPFFMVMKKFGLPTEFIKERTRATIASRTWRPRIPDWIKYNDECMHAFFEGYINGRNSSASLSAARGAARVRPALGAHFYLRPKGFYEEDIKKFTEDLKAWVEQNGIHAGFRKGKYGYNHIGHTCYEIAISSQEGLLWLMTSFDIQRPDIRAKLFARLKSYKDPVIRWALTGLRSPDNAVFGMLLEEPLTVDELENSLQMQRAGITPCLVALQRKGLVERRGDRYFYNSEEYVKNTISKDAAYMKALSRKAYKYSERLLYQCSECGRVYMHKRDACGRCGSEVLPVERVKILSSIHHRRARTRIRINQLKEALE